MNTNLTAEPDASRCPCCGTPTQGSAPQANRRRRRCPQCRYCYNTIEVRITDYRQLRQAVAQAEQKLEALRTYLATLEERPGPKHE